LIGIVERIWDPELLTQEVKNSLDVVKALSIGGMDDEFFRVC
jgi:hypothetical protein